VGHSRAYATRVQRLLGMCLNILPESKGNWDCRQMDKCGIYRERMKSGSTGRGELGRDYTLDIWAYSEWWDTMGGIKERIELVHNPEPFKCTL